MSFRQNAFWIALTIVFAGLTLWILGLAVFAPKPEPLSMGREEVLPPPQAISTIAAIWPPGKESPAVKSFIDAGSLIGKYQKIKGWVYVAGQQTRG